MLIAAEHLLHMLMQSYGKSLSFCLRATHLQLGQALVLWRHLDAKALDHGLLNIADNSQCLTLLDGHLLLVLGINDLLELNQLLVQLGQSSNTSILR